MNAIFPYGSVGGMEELRWFDMLQKDKQPIHDENELSFAIFCIENVAIALGVTADKVYRALAEKSDILNGYIIPCYEVLHSQSKEYIVADIISFMKEKEVEA